MSNLLDALSALAYAAAVLVSIFVLAVSVAGFARTSTPPDFSAMFDPSEPAVTLRHDARHHSPVAVVEGGTAVRG